MGAATAGCNRNNDLPRNSLGCRGWCLYHQHQLARREGDRFHRFCHSGEAMKRQLGFTLSELMIAMLLGLLLTGSVIGVYLSNSRTAELNTVLGELQNSSRTTFELMANDIRRSGYIGCGNASRVVNVLNAANVAGSAWAIWNGGIEGFEQPAPAINGVSPLSGTDAIRLMFGSGRSYTVESHDAALNQLVLSTEHQIQSGDLLMLCDEALSSIFSASGTDLPSVFHEVSASNCSSGM